jgi:PIN domain nuclease of toxin-antitoxin system
LGKLEINNISVRDLPEIIDESGIKILPLNIDACCSFSLPKKPNHRDPFDRMLIWQAIFEKLTMVSSDQHFASYQEDGLRLA